MEHQRVVVAGETAVDVIVNGVGPGLTGGQSELLVDDARLVMGGSGAITAAALSGLGVPTAFVGTVGDDHLGAFFVAELQRFGVDVSAIRHLDGRRTGMTIALEHGGDRTMLTYAGTMGDLAAHDVRDDLLAGAAHLHVSSWFLQRGLHAGMGELLARAHGAGLTVSLDPGWDVDGTWNAGLEGIIGEIDWFLPNAAEAENIAATLRSQSGAGGAEQALDVLATAGRGVVVKRGGEGAAGRIGQVTWRLDTEPIVAVDTTGAGDNFDAGFIAALVAGHEPPAGMALAVACGRHAIGGRGGTGRLADRTTAEAAAAALAARVQVALPRVDRPAANATDARRGR